MLDALGWPSSSLYSFCICRLSNDLVENKKICFKKTYHWQGLERRHVSSPYTFQPFCCCDWVLRWVRVVVVTIEEVVKFVVIEIVEIIIAK